MKVELTIYYDEGGYDQQKVQVPTVKECEECGAKTINKRPESKVIGDALRHAVEILFP